MKLLKYLLIAAVGILLFVSIRQCSKAKTDKQQYINMIDSANDSLKITRDELGRQIAETSVIVAEKEDLELLTSAKDDEIWMLKDLVKQRGKQLKAALVLSANTRLDTVLISRVEKGDTIWKVKTEYRDRWIDLTAETDLNADSSEGKTKVQLKVANDFKIWKEYDKVGKWPNRKKVLKVFVQSDNPYTEVDTLKSWEIPIEHPRRLSFGPVAAYGINEDLKRHVFIGAGVMYRIF